jgi:branched-chain amino acid transport system substrate-binding protein
LTTGGPRRIGFVSAVRPLKNPFKKDQSGEMTMRRREAIGGLGAALAASALPTPSIAQSVKDVPLGAILALTGPASIYAVGDAASISLAVKELTNDGGFMVAGQTCRLVLREEDTGSKPQQVIAATQKMLDAGDVKFIVGPTTTGDWVAAWGLLSKADVINISFATAVLPYLGTPAGKNLFFPNRGIKAPIDAAVATAASMWHPKSAAMLIPGDAVGQAVGPIIKAALAAAGVKLVYDSTFAPASREFSSQLTAIKAVQPDLLVSGYFDDMMSTVMRQAVELGVTKKFLGMRGVSEASGLPLKGQIDGLVFPLVARDPSDPEMATFNTSYEKYFSKAPDRVIANGIGLHDAIDILVAAMQLAGTTTDVDKVSAAMRQVTSYKHNYLGLKFDKDGLANHVQEVGVFDGSTGKTTFVSWKG